MMKKILIAYDDSDHSHKAFSVGLEFAQKFNARLYVISVVQLPEPAIDVETEEFIENASNHYKQMFGALKTKTNSHHVEHDFEVIVGHPAQTIVDYAKDNHMDLIILGATKGKSFLQRVMLGSVSKQVVDHAHCSVLVTR